MTLRSIITVRSEFYTPCLAGAIEDLTYGRVVKITLEGGRVVFEIEHHEGPVCPHCDEPIHAHGHGLCIKCWTEFRGGLIKK